MNLKMLRNGTLSVKFGSGGVRFPSYLKTKGKRGRRLQKGGGDAGGAAGGAASGDTGGATKGGEAGGELQGGKASGPGGENGLGPGNVKGGIPAPKNGESTQDFIANLEAELALAA